MPPPDLVLDSIGRDEREPTRLVGQIRLVGHPLQVVLDLTHQDAGLIEFAQMPTLLAAHLPAQQLVVAAMTSLDRQDGPATTAALPLDLSGQLVGCDPPFPWRRLEPAALQRLLAEASSVTVDVLDRSRSGSRPASISAHLVVDGRPVELVVEAYDEPGALPILRWVDGPSPDEFTPAQREAIQDALIGPHRGC
jgi:hypothetical protein